jgi:glycine/D-amino acid oxidase-like deaminating enzyme
VIHDAVIIGGGIAGLACARRLHQAGKDFLLVSDKLGGRMFSAGDGLSNHGATYITSDYKHVGKFVRKSRRAWFQDVFYRDGNRWVMALSPRNIRHTRAFSVIYFQLTRFRARMKRLRAQCPHVCQAELLARDPLLARFTREPAREFVEKLGLSEVNQIFFNPILHSTLFVEFEAINVFYYLGVLMPVLLPTYLADFSDTVEKMTKGFRDKIVTDRVTELRASAQGGYHIQTEGRDLQARRVVVTTPGHNLRAFCPELDRADRDGVRELPCRSIHVVGARREEYLPGKIVFLRPEHSSTVIQPLSLGRELLLSGGGKPDLETYYHDARIVADVTWKTAVQISGSTWRPLAPRPDLFTIGDYNIIGLEDSYLTGLFAANRIIG